MNIPLNPTRFAKSLLKRPLLSHANALHTAQERSRWRYVRAAMTGGATALNKAISIATSVFTVRFTFQYLGVERYGMWMTITSVVLMLGFADFGMSNGLVNMVAESLGRKDERAAQRAVASAFWMLSSVAAVAVVGMMTAYTFVDTSRLFNVHSPLAVHESGPTLLVLFSCFALSLPLGAVRGTQTGMQNGFINNLWNSLGALGSLAAVVIAIHFRAGLPVLALSLAGPPVLATLLNGMNLFMRSHPNLIPDPRVVSRSSASRLFHTGMMFFLLQVAFSVGMQTDNVVIAQIMGAGSVAAYAVPARMFNMVTSIMVMVSGSVWPAYVDALAQSDGEWIYRTFMRVVVWGTAISMVLAATLLIFGNRILALWVGSQLQAPVALLGAFGLLCVVNAYLQPVSFLLNGVGEFRVQVINAILMAVVNIGLSILFVKKFGIVGAVLGTVAALTLVQVIPLTIVAVRVLKKLRYEVNFARPIDEVH